MKGTLCEEAPADLRMLVDEEDSDQKAHFKFSPSNEKLDQS